MHQKEKKSGRPKKFSLEIEQQICENFKNGAITSLWDGKELVLKKNSIKVCKQSIKNCLNRNNLKCFIKHKKPLVSDNHGWMSGWSAPPLCFL